MVIRTMALSEGALRTIMSGGSVDAPIMQIVGTRKLRCNGATARYQVLVSDGLYTYEFAMLAPQLNDKISNGELDEYSVIRISQFIPTFVRNLRGGEKRVLILLDIDVVLPGAHVGHLIGNPEALIVDEQPSATRGAASAPTAKRSTAPLRALTSSSSRSGRADGPMTKLTTSTPTQSIFSLTPLSSKWVLKARVSKKMIIRTWCNVMGKGKLFSFDILDNSGEIRITAFNEQCDKFYNLIEVGKVYVISRGVVKRANKQFNALNNDYEVTLNTCTEIIPVLEDTSEIPTALFNFSPLSDVENMAAETVVDVIGVCRSVDDLITFTARTSKKKMKKLDVYIADRSMVSVALTLWGQEAEKFNGKGQPVVAVKGGRVHVFEGVKSVTASSCSSLFINPNIPQAHQLRGWYDNEGSTLQYKNISERGKNLASLEELLPLAEQSDATRSYYSCKATIIAMKRVNAIYSSCPEKNCFKKVVDLNNGLYRCENCEQDYPDCNHRLLLQICVVDWSSRQWFMCFFEAAEEILGRSTLELKELKEKDLEAYQRVFDNVNYTAKIFRVRAEWKTLEHNEYNEQRLNVTVLSTKPVDHAAYSRQLLEELKDLCG